MQNAECRVQSEEFNVEKAQGAPYSHGMRAHKSSLLIRVLPGGENSEKLKPSKC